MTETTITLDEEMFGRIESALNLAIGMASVHAKTSLQELLDLANELDDMWRDAESAA